MGTRNLICVYHKGRFIIAQYTQWDGYPDGQGVRLLTWLLDPANLPRLLAGIEHVQQISEEQLQNSNMTPALSRDTGAIILELAAQAHTGNPLKVHRYLDFAEDALFCEWAYIVDLDDKLFQTFRGGVGEKKGTLGNRFVQLHGGSSHLRLVDSSKLDELPSCDEYLGRFPEGEEVEYEESEEEENDDGDDEKDEDDDVEDSNKNNEKDSDDGDKAVHESDVEAD